MTSSPSSAQLADRIVQAVLDRYDNLPTKFKPTKDSHGVCNWVPLSGIVLETPDGKLNCVSLATGMKCLPASKIPDSGGLLLHDSHAEVLALRAFNHFLLQECRKLCDIEGYTSMWLMESGVCGLPYTIRKDIKIHMYCSEAPCGDASMELIMQKQEDATPWTAALPSDGLLGRGHFSELGVVRRKPARADSPESLSKSCSDKIALKQCLSILSCHTSQLVAPENVYLASIILPESQAVPTALSRCFGSEGRMATLSGVTWASGYCYRPFQVLTTSKEFQYSRRAIDTTSNAPKPSNLTAIWNPSCQEVIINGILQGRKQSQANCASALSRSSLARELAHLTSDEASKGPRMYRELKRHPEQLIRRGRIKAQVIESALPGWIMNVVDDFPVRFVPPATSSSP